jgi:hypothetical protein
MSANTQLDFVEGQLKVHTDFYTNRRNFNRRAAFRLTVLPASLSAIATVLVGASEKLGTTWPSILAMIASGAASVLGAWQAFFSNRKLWVANNATLATIYELQSDIEFRKADTSTPITKAEIDRFYDRSKQISNDAEQALASAYAP